MLEENLKYIEEMKKFGIKPGLERIEKALNLLNISPKNSFKIIHITGTNGKGSTSTLTANILKESGYRTGLYLSPYVVKFNERIQINSQQISDKDLDDYITKLREILSKNNLETTFFEFITALALLYFKDNKVEFLVFEAGMGGKDDATNIMASIISVITNIDLDHQQYFGNSKEGIAEEKAGIIKKNQVFITAEEDEKFKEYFKKICLQQNSKFVSVSEVISAQKSQENLKYQSFSTKGIFKDNFDLALLGDHQIKNALTALTIASELQKLNWKIPLAAIIKALKETKIPGRIEIVSEKPLIIVDGAHNPHGISALKEYIEEIPNKKTLVIAIKEDKDSKKMLDLIAPAFKNIIVTKGNLQPKDPELIAQEAKKHTKNIFVIPNVKQAIKKALEITKEDDFLLITGSLYMIGEALKVLKEKTIA